MSLVKLGMCDGIVGFCLDDNIVVQRHHALVNNALNNVEMLKYECQINAYILVWTVTTTLKIRCLYCFL